LRGDFAAALHRVSFGDLPEVKEVKKMNYNPSTIDRIADFKVGLRVDTGTLLNTTYLLSSGPQTELFTVVGRIFLLQLYAEVIVACSANATQVLFNATFTTPTVSVANLCAKCASVSGIAAGRRIVWVGGAVATAAVITASAGISDVTPSNPHIIGGVGWAGTIGMLASDASQGSGSIKVSMHYVPAYDGSYVQALL
jgi:hypothetical protein